MPSDCAFFMIGSYPVFFLMYRVLLKGYYGILIVQCVNTIFILKHVECRNNSIGNT